MSNAPRLYAAVLTHRPGLLADFSAVLEAVAAAVKNTAKQSVQEPDMVAGLVLGGTRLLGQALAEPLAEEGIQTRVAGIFCHNLQRDAKRQARLERQVETLGQEVGTRIALEKAACEWLGELTQRTAESAKRELRRRA